MQPSVPVGPPPSSDSQISHRILWLLLVILAALLLAVRYAEQDALRESIAATGVTTNSVNLLERRAILSADGCQWVMQTQQMFDQRTARVRETSHDNYPFGREVHWASAYRWLLGSIAWVWAEVRGTPLHRAVEDVAPYANPLLLAILFPLAAAFVWRVYGPRAAGLTAIVVATCTTFVELFGLGDPDHHGLAAVCGLASVAFLLAGTAGRGRSSKMQHGASLWEQRGSRWIAASGVVAGAGLWISAASQIPILVGVAVGALLVPYVVKHRGAAGEVPVPVLWRVWGVSGAIASAIFYLLEYFPSHMGMRLEVNHPLYALAFWAGGEFICRVLRMQTAEKAPERTRDGVVAAICAVAVMTPVLVILATKPGTFQIADPMLWALHKDYITEFYSIGRRAEEIGLFRSLLMISPVPLAAIPASVLLFRGKLDAGRMTQLLVSTVPAVLVFVLSLDQIRWLGLSGGLFMNVLVVLIWLWDEHRPRLSARVCWVAVGYFFALVAPAIWLIATAAPNTLFAQRRVAVVDVRAAIVRDVAAWLKARVGETRAVVLSSPGITTRLMYHAGIEGVGTLYWENLQGLRALVEICGTSEISVAKQLIAERGITHIVICSWDTFAAPAARLNAGLRRSAPVPEGALLAQLAQGRGCPPWLRPVSVPQAVNRSEGGERVLVYEVVPEQTRERAALSHAEFLFDSGRLADAETFTKVFVAHFPQSLSGWILVARVESAQGRADQFAEAVSRVRNLRAAGSGQALGFSEQLNLAIVLGLAGDESGAADEFLRCLRAATTEEVRKLPVDALYSFSMLAEAIGRGERAELLGLARSLLPRQTDR